MSTRSWSHDDIKMSPPPINNKSNHKENRLLKLPGLFFYWVSRISSFLGSYFRAFGRHLNRCHTTLTPITRAMTTAPPAPGFQHPTSPAQMFYPATSFNKTKKSTPASYGKIKGLSSPTFRVETSQLPRLLLTALCMQAIFFAGECVASYPPLSPKEWQNSHCPG